MIAHSPDGSGGDGCGDASAGRWLAIQFGSTCPRRRRRASGKRRNRLACIGRARRLSDPFDGRRSRYRPAVRSDGRRRRRHGTGADGPLVSGHIVGGQRGRRFYRTISLVDQRGCAVRQRCARRRRCSCRRKGSIGSHRTRLDGGRLKQSSRRLGYANGDDQGQGGRDLKRCRRRRRICRGGYSGYSPVFRCIRGRRLHRLCDSWNRAGRVYRRSGGRQTRLCSLKLRRSNRLRRWKRNAANCSLISMNQKLVPRR